MIIIVESGATKSDWRVIDSDGNLRSRQLLSGMNVSTISMDRIKEVLVEGLEKTYSSPEDCFYLYTAGVVTPEIFSEIREFIFSKVRFSDFDVQNDLIGAARSVLGHNCGIAAIMGTGSNTCFYDGVGVSQKVMSGGYVIGDDGSGAALGKMFLTDYIKNLIPKAVAEDFSSKFDASYAGIVENVYRSAAPSGYLGSLAPFILSHYDDPDIRKMVDENFQRFIDRSLKCYDTEKYPVGIVGGFGYANQKIFSSLCEKSGVRVVGYVREPVEGLIKYHIGK